MSSSRNLEEVAEQALREKAEMEARLKLLQTQLGKLMRERRRDMRSTPTPSEPSDPDESDSDYNPFGSPSEASRSSRRHGRHHGGGFNDFKVDIPEFEGKLDPDEFLDWLQTVERVFDYKDIPDEKKVKLVALKLRRYASTWWANVLSKRAKKGKGKIRTWRKMKEKLKGKFLPSHYLQENFSKLHHLKQGSLSVEEYTREFEQLVIKCDLKEGEEQALVRYLGGLDKKIAYVVDLHPYATLDELSYFSSQGGTPKEG